MSFGSSTEEHLRVDHLKGDLKKRSVRGGAIVFVSQGTKFVLQTGSTMVLARLLVPADFGLVAMVTAVTGFVALFKDLGLSLATVQREEITINQVNASFWINAGVGVLVTMLTAALAPVLAWLYHEPRLTWVTVALSFGFLISGVSVQHYALLQRQMRFGTLAIIDVGSLAVQVLAAIAFARYGAGYWALVWMSLIGAATNTILLWSLCRWRPKFAVHYANVRPLLSYGGYVTGFNTVNYWGRNLDRVLIGWRWGAEQLGFYGRAYSLLLFPLTYINTPATTVMLPALSRLQGEPSRFRSAYRQYLTAISSVTLPVVAVCIILSKEIIAVALGAQWAPAVPIFRILACAGLIQVITNQCGTLLLAIGYARRYFGMGLLAAIVTIGAFVAGLPYGAVGVAVAYAICSWVAAIPIACYASWHTPVHPTDMAKAVGRPVILTLAVAAAVCALETVLSNMTNPLLRLVAGLGVAGGMWFWLVHLPWYRSINPVDLFVSAIRRKGQEAQ